MKIILIEGRERTSAFADKIREAGVEHSGIINDLYRLARNIELYGDVALEEVREIKSIAREAMMLAVELTKILREVDCED